MAPVGPNTVQGAGTPARGSRSRSRLSMRTGALVLGVVAVMLTGCVVEQPEVVQVASTFAAADPAARCKMLAPATVAAVEAESSEPCVRAMAQLSLPEGAVVSSTVRGDVGQVQLVGDTVFLVRTATGWKVTAAGCRSPDTPHDCLLTGP